MFSFRSWLRKLAPAPKKRPANRRTFRPVIEELEPRVVPAWNMTVSYPAATVNVTSVFASGTTTFTATGTGANLNWQDVDNALGSGNVVINSGSTGAEAGNITDQTAINLVTPANETLTFQSGTGSGLVGNISLTDLALQGTSESVLIQAAGSVTTGVLSANSTTSPTALANVQITATGGSVTGGAIYATDLAVQAKGNIGSSGTPLSTNVSNLVANVTGTTGGIYIDNTGNLNIGYIGDPFQNVRVLSGSGAIVLNNAGTVDITGTNEGVYSFSGPITINATGSSSDITTGGGNLTAVEVRAASNSAVKLDAGRNLVLGTAGKAGNILGGGPVNLIATGNITVDEGTTVESFGPGNGVTATAGGNISILDTTVAGAAILCNGLAPTISLNTGAGGTFTLNSGAGGKVYSDGGDITIKADSMVISDPISAGNGTTTGNVTLEQATTTTRNIVLGGTTAGNLAISNADLAEITANAVRIGRTDNAGSISVTAGVNPTGFGTLHLYTGAGITQTAGITVNQLAIDAAGPVTLTGINFVGTLAANVTNGNISFYSYSPSLTVGSVDGDTGVTANGSVNLLTAATSGNLYLAADVKSSTSTVNLSATSANLYLSGGARTLTGSTVTLSSVGLLGNGNDLTVTGNAVFKTSVSTIGNLSVSGTTDIYDNIGTTKKQTYTGAVTLDRSVTLSSTGTGSNGNINFKSTVDGVSGGGQTLTVNTAGTTIFGGAVGFNFQLGSLTTDAPGSTQINGGFVETITGQTYNDNVTLGQNTELLASRTVAFNGNLTLGPTAATATDTLNLTGGGNLAISGTLFTQINGTSAGSFGNIFLDPAFDEAVTLTGSTLTATGGTSLAGGNLTLISTQGRPISGTFSNYAEGSTVTLNGIPFTISYVNFKVTLTAQAPTTVYVDQSFFGTSPGNNPATAPTGLTLQYDYNAFADIQSGLNALASGGTLVVFADSAPLPYAGFTVNNPVAAFDINENPQDPAGTNSVIIGGLVTLNQNVTFTQNFLNIPPSTVLPAADLEFQGNIVTGGTPVSLSVNGNSNKNVAFDGSVGTNSAPLSNLTVGGGTTQINGGSVNTTGFTQTYNDNVTLGSAFTILAGIVDFNAGLTLGTDTLQIAGTLNFTSTTTLTTTFTGTSPSQVGHILVGGGNTTYGNATLNVIYAGGFTPAPGNSFDVVSNGGFGIGQFVNAPSPGVFSFGGVKYSAVYNGSAGGGDFIMTALSANQNYIEALYQTFLGRPGTQPEWNYWVPLLSSLGRAGVVSRIEYSSEASNRLVDQFYEYFLNRPAIGDPGAQTWVNQLVQHYTEEQVIADIVSGPEFASRANALVGTTDPNFNYVQALYKLLLNRTGSNAEVQYWEGRLPSLGRFTVAASFQLSSEYRTGAVDTFYGDPSLPVLPFQPFFPEFFHRTPAASDVNYWVNLPLALLGIEQDFAASNEFYNDNS